MRKAASFLAFNSGHEDGFSFKGPACILQSVLHVQLQQVTDATLALFVDEIFTVAEIAV